MKPSNAVDDLVEVLDRLRLLDLGDDREVDALLAMILRTSSASLASRTKLSAMKSTVRCSANRRSSMSFSDSAGTDTATPGRLMPLLLLTLPPTSTSVCTSVPSTTPVTRSRILPSSIRSGSPTFTSPGRPLYVVPQIVVVAGHVAGGDRPLLAAAQLRPDRRRTSRAGSSGPGGRRRCRPRARSRRRPRARGGRPRRGPRGCRGSCSAGRRPSRRTPARGSDAGEDGRRAEGADDLGSTHGLTLARL